MALQSQFAKDSVWFPPVFDGYELPIFQDGSFTLILTELISAKIADNHDNIVPVYGTGIYLAKRKPPGTQAFTGDQAVVVRPDLLTNPEIMALPEFIVKIWMQLPNFPDFDKQKDIPQIYPQPRVLQIKQYIQEALAYDSFTKHNCSSTPRWIADFSKLNMSNPYVIDGFIHAMILEKMPGETLADVWPRVEAQEGKIKKQRLMQAKFIEALTEIQDCRVLHDDPRRHNVLWDEKAQKFYLIDFESSGTYDDGEFPKLYDMRKPKFARDQCWVWGLDNHEVYPDLPWQ